MNIAIERVFQSNNWVAVVFVTVFVLITIVKIIYPKRFQVLLGCMFSKKYFLDYTNELSERLRFFDMGLFFAQNLIGALFLFLVLRKEGWMSDVEDSFLFLELFLGLISYFFIQDLLRRLVGVLFGLAPLLDQVNALKFSYLKIVLFLFIPFILVRYYSLPESDWMYRLMLGILILLLVIRWFLIIKNNNKLIIKRLFYFILYLCTLEIVPLLMFSKIMVK